MRHVCLRNPFVPFVLGIPSIHSLPEAWGSWEPQYAPPALHFACIMPIPLLQLQEKPVLRREAEGLVTELWSPRSVKIQWLCSQLCYLTAANQWTIFEIELLATVGWKWGCQPISCPRLQSVTQCQTRFVGHVCFRNPFPAFLLGIPSIHSLPEAWTPALHYGCIMPIPSLHLQKKTSLMQWSRGFGQGVVVSKIYYNAVIVLSVALWDCCKPTNTCRDWAFSNSGLEVGLPAFQLSMFAKCGSLPKRDLCDMFVSGIHSRHSFWEFQASTPYQKLEVPESGSTLHQFWIMLASCPSLCCSCRKNPVSCREAEGLVMDLWSPRLVTMQWLCSQLPAFQLPMFTKCDSLVCWTCLSKESMPFNLSLHSLPEAWVRESGSTFCQLYITLWLHHAHPFVAAAEKGRKSLSYAEKQRFWSRSCCLQNLLRNIPISDVSMWPLQNNEYCNFRDWAFNHGGLEVGLPAFQLPMFAECDTLPKGDLFDMFV